MVIYDLQLINEFLGECRQEKREARRAPVLSEFDLSSADEPAVVTDNTIDLVEGLEQEDHFSIVEPLVGLSSPENDPEK